MASAVYPKGKEAFLSALVDLTSATIKAALVTSAYTYSSADQFLSAIGANTVGTAQTLGTKTVTNGVFNAANLAFTGLSATATVQAVVLYKDTGVAGTSNLIAYIDAITNFPVSLTPATTEIDVNWDTGASKIFAL